MSRNDKIKGLISETPSGWKNKAQERISNKGWKKNSRAVALRVLSVLREREMSQAELAEKMGVSRQQVSKILQGHENLTFETVDKLETALDIRLMKIEKGYAQPGVTKFILPVTTFQSGSYRTSVRMATHSGLDSNISPVFYQQYSDTYDQTLYEKYSEDLCTPFLS